MLKFDDTKLWCRHTLRISKNGTRLVLFAPFAQAFLRLALSVSYLSAVADRFGLWGAPGSPGVSWGNWQNFVAYSNSVNGFLPTVLGNVLAVGATALEIIIPAFLLIGYKTRFASVASGILLGLFALGMTISFGVKAPLDYSV